MAKPQLDIDKILKEGRSVIKELTLSQQKEYLDSYLSNYLRVYKHGIDTIDRKILFYESLHDGDIRAIVMTKHLLPNDSKLQHIIKSKLHELREKRKEWQAAAEKLPQKLPLLLDDDPEFKKTMIRLNTGWYMKNSCRVLGMCVCEIAQYAPYQATCLPISDDFSLLR